MNIDELLRNRLSRDEYEETAKFIGKQCLSTCFIGTLLGTLITLVVTFIVHR